MWSTIFELLEFIRKNRKLWMIPILFILLLAGAVMVVTEGSVIAPLLYTLF